MRFLFIFLLVLVSSTQFARALELTPLEKLLSKEKSTTKSPFNVEIRSLINRDPGVKAAIIGAMDSQRRIQDIERNLSSTQEQSSLYDTLTIEKKRWEKKSLEGLESAVAVVEREVKRLSKAYSVDASMSQVLSVLKAALEEQKVLTSASSRQKEFIFEINQIIEQVKVPLSPVELQILFFSNGGSIDQARYILLGERHDDFKSLVELARALETLITPHEVVLFEGNEAGNKKDCDLNILELYVVSKWNSLERPYEAKEFNTFYGTYTDLFRESKPALHLSELKLHEANCYYWDHEDAAGSQTDFESLSNRNAKLVEYVSNLTRRWANPTGGHVFIKAGYFHLPSGDVESFKSDQASFPKEAEYFHLQTSQLAKLRLPNYYKVLQEAEPAGRKLAEFHGYGSTEVIYDFLKAKAYTELIPASVLNLNQPCGEACE